MRLDHVRLRGEVQELLVTLTRSGGLRQPWCAVKSARRKGQNYSFHNFLLSLTVQPYCKSRLTHNGLVPEKVKAGFLEPMLLLRTDHLPDGDDWLYELKHDGYRGIGYKTGGKPYLRSRNNNDFSSRYATVAKALAALPNETVVDG